jgi:integrase
MGRPVDWKRAAKNVYTGDGRLWIRVTVTLPGGRSLEWGPRQCPAEWGTGRVGIAKATVRAEEIAEQMRDGSLVRSVPVSETVEAFTKRHRDALNVRASTQATWWSCARQWLPTLGALPIAALTARDVQRWQDSTAGEEWKPLYRRNVIRTLRQVLEAAHRDGLHRTNLALRLSAATGTAQASRDNLTWEDVTPTLLQMPPYYARYFFLLGLTGMRGMELRTATPDDFTDGWLHVSEARSKTRTARRIPIPSELTYALHAWLSGPRPDFAGTIARSHWRRSDLPETPHALRRMCVSELDALGVRKVLVSALVGHSAQSMTEFYDGPRGRSEMVDMMERYWSSRVRSVYRQLVEAHDHQ